VGAGEHSQAVEFASSGRGRPGFTVPDAIVGDLQLDEMSKIDGDLESFISTLIVRRSQCPYIPRKGQRVTLASGRVCSVDTVMTEASDGVTLPMQIRAEVNG
jgi:hypothetical protein